MKAVIEVAGKQYIVEKGRKIQVDRLADGTETLEIEPMLVFDDNDVKVGMPTIKGMKVTAKVVEAEIKADKVHFIRFKAKKRVHKIGGHRQRYSIIEVISVA